MSHTPGPWRIGEYCQVVTPKGDTLLVYGVAQPLGNHPCVEESKANSRLIAAAPDLLEALEDACLSHAAFGDQPPEKWLAAIKKAKG